MGMTMMTGFNFFGKRCPKVTVKISGHMETAEKFVPGDIIDAAEQGMAMAFHLTDPNLCHTVDLDYLRRYGKY